MGTFSGTQSEQNILTAFAGESQARNRYTFFAEQASKEGHTDIALMFEKMAKNEMMHAKILFRLLHDGLGESSQNVQQAAAGENQEWRSMYPDFAKIAREEGFEQLAQTFERVADIERDHEKTFLKAFVALQEAMIQENGVPVAQEEHHEEKTIYRCMFCGAMYDKRPDVCSMCGAIGSFETGLAHSD